MTTARSIRAALVGYLTTAGLSTRRANANLDAFAAEVRAEAYRQAAAAVLADTAHITYGSATDYAERHAALLNRMADAAEAGEQQ